MSSRVDTHVHTYYSGTSNYKALKFPESVAKPEDQVERARKIGMRILCITDHDAIAGALAAEAYARKYDDFDVIVGEEVTTADGEVLAYFINEKIKPYMSIEETLDEIRSQGGLAAAPHPYSFYVPCLKDRINDLNLDGIEVINGGHVDKYTNKRANLAFMKNPGRWAALSGSDAHSVYTMGYNWTEFEGETPEDFRNAVLHKKTTPHGVPAPVFSQVQWSVQVVLVAQKMLLSSLRGKLEDDPENPLIHKMNTIKDVKKIGGIIGGAIYLTPPVPFIGAFAATKWLEKRSQKLVNSIEYKLELTSCPRPPIN